jgi:hypothetical protein
MKVQLLYFEGCPHWRTAEERLARLAAERGIALARRVVATPEQAEAAGFRGSPTILVDGHDPFAGAGEPIGLSCRMYQTPAGPAGSPTDEQLRAVLDG